MLHSWPRLTPGLLTVTTPSLWLKLVLRLAVAAPSPYTLSVAWLPVETDPEVWPSTSTLYSHTSVV